MIGKVKWFNDAKGYGFIELEQGRDVFVHYSVIESEGYRSLKEGQEVAFELSRGPKGDHALWVKRPGEPDGDLPAAVPVGLESA